MKDEWYGDHRDLVKWTVLLHIADQFSCRYILQVLYLRDSGWGSIKIGDIEIQLHKSVIKHFRRTDAVSALDSNLTIETIDEILHNHDEYLSTIKHRISHRHLSPSIIFLDPDTGLEPLSSRPTLEHVRANDLRSIWDQCKKDDVLVLYQHAYRDRDWREQKKRQFLEILHVHPEMAYAPNFKGAKMWPSFSRKKIDALQSSHAANRR